MCRAAGAIHRNITGFSTFFNYILLLLLVIFIYLKIDSVYLSYNLKRLSLIPFDMTPHLDQLVCTLLKEK